LHPIGEQPIAEQVHAGSKVVIIFPDRVKGGYGEFSHRKVTSKIVVEECLKAGVEEKDILFLCSNGFTGRTPPRRSRKSWAMRSTTVSKGQILNHDSEDWDHLVDLGNEPKFGAKVVINKYVYDADLAVMIGHVQGNPYGGYSGGYKHCATGISNWECISSHHCPAVMHRPDFVPVSDHSLDAAEVRRDRRLDGKEDGEEVLLRRRRPRFLFSNQIAVFAGYAKETEPLSWEIADKRTYVKWAKKKYDVLVFGLPNDFQYGSSQGRNPILVEQAIAAQIIRLKRVTSEHPVIIALRSMRWRFRG
jgi:hypothetical protein